MSELDIALNTPSESGVYQTLNELDREVDQIKAGVAFVTKAGLDSFQSATNSITTNSTQQWIVSVNEGITQPQAIRALSEQSDTEVRIANGEELLKSEDLTASSQFHPKCVWFERGENHDLMTGSANLTQRGFHSNWEACLLAKDLQTGNHRTLLAKLEDWWEQAWSRSKVVTPDVIDTYSEIRESYIDRTPPDYLRRITDRETALEDATILWAEVETVMGWNDQKFEVPMPCFRFFTRKHDSLSIGDQTDITFVYEGSRYPDRSIRIHQNQMCRINLPNRLGKRFDLTDYSIVIEYLDEGTFKVDLIPDDEQAQTLEPLRRESSNHGQVLTMDRKDREYGWV